MAAVTPTLSKAFRELVDGDTLRNSNANSQSGWRPRNSSHEAVVRELAMLDQWLNTVLHEIALDGRQGLTAHCVVKLCGMFVCVILVRY